MITPQYALTMAQYNHWQNTSCISATDQLSAADRGKDCGAFFGSVEATLNHILWGDWMWLSRFGGSDEPPVSTIPESTSMTSDWDTYKSKRIDIDARIESWAGRVQQSELDNDLTYYSGSTGREVTKPMALLVVHMFNHQTHHRGQIHAMLTAFGLKTDTTDLPFRGV